MFLVFTPNRRILSPENAREVTGSRRRGPEQRPANEERHPFWCGIMMRARAAATLLLASAADGQLNIPTVADGTCDLGTFYDRIVSLDAVCCFEAAGSPGARCAGAECDVPCAAQLLPLLHECHAIVDKMFDSDDGLEDGIASQFDTVYNACLHIDNTVALQALEDLQSQGLCTDEMLNGVGETAVAEAPCEDSRDGCDALIASGFMTCAADFAPTGRMAGMCDRTCAFCDGPAGPPPPCDDLRDGCSGTIATGFVSCASDFCPDMPDGEPVRQDVRLLHG